DGNILLSCRSLDAIVKIDIATGKILWQLGGVHDMFTWIGEPLKFSGQHDLRRLSSGHLTMFDNGNFHDASVVHDTVFSRAVEYALDEEAKTITKVWQYRHTPDLSASAMGSVQRLDNG